MTLRQTSHQLVLAESSVFAAIAVAFCGTALITTAGVNIGVTSENARIVALIVGGAVMLLGTFGFRQLRIIFDRTDETVSLTRAPIVPSPLLRTSTRTGDLATFAYAYVERTMTGKEEKALYHLALAKEGLPAIMLDLTRTPPLVASDESVRWILSVSGPLGFARAATLARDINRWLGVNPPAQDLG